MPKDYRSDGEDIAKALRGDSFRRSKPQFWHYPARSPSLAVRIGDWKLLSNPDGRLEELYNLANDPGETNNLASAQPKQVKAMKAALLAWHRELPIAKATAK